MHAVLALMATISLALSSHTLHHRPSPFPSTRTARMHRHGPGYQPTEEDHERRRCLDAASLLRCQRRNEQRRIQGIWIAAARVLAPPPPLPPPPQADAPDSLSGPIGSRRGLVARISPIFCIFHICAYNVLYIRVFFPEKLGIQLNIL